MCLFSATADTSIDPKNVQLKSLYVNDLAVVEDYKPKIAEKELSKYCQKKLIEETDVIEVKVMLGDVLKPVDGKKYTFGLGTVLTQKIDDDPIFFQEASQVVTDLSVTLHAPPQEGIHAVFEEIGVGGAFVKDHTEAPQRGLVKRTAVQALLPRQGFAIVMARRDPIPIRPDGDGAAGEKPAASGGAAEHAVAEGAAGVS